MENSYHVPVLLHDAVNGLNINPSGIYVDVTFGGGGHAKLILSQLDSGKLIGFDQDPDAERSIEASENFVFIPQNFRYIKNYLKINRFPQVDGILADLGVSSHQFDVAERGFSFRFDGPLDMRMSQQGDLTAARILNEYSEEDLISIFKLYGELNNAWQITRKIIQTREDSPFEEISDLRNSIESLVPSRKQSQFLAKVFQALRIEVNQEMEVLKEMLLGALDSLRSGGRFSVISYHSLEDRLVKNFFKTGNFEGSLEKDFYGNPQTPFKQITRKPLMPSEEEIEINGRARSAKLRVAEKI